MGGREAIATGSEARWRPSVNAKAGKPSKWPCRRSFLASWSRELPRGEHCARRGWPSAAPLVTPGPVRTRPGCSWTAFSWTTGALEFEPAGTLQRSPSSTAGDDQTCTPRSLELIHRVVAAAVIARLLDVDPGTAWKTIVRWQSFCARTSHSSRNSSRTHVDAQVGTRTRSLARFSSSRLNRAERPTLAVRGRALAAPSLPQPISGTTWERLDTILSSARQA